METKNKTKLIARNFSLTILELETLSELKKKTGFTKSLLIRLAISLLNKNFKRRKKISIV